MKDKCILIDNYDSFTYNIVQYLKELGVEPTVFENDKITIDELKKMDFSSIIISPGPKNPNKAGISMEVIKEFYKPKKILGICLGHQCIAQFFGGKIIKDKNPTHGKVSKIYFTPNPIFEGLEQGFEATRYHSLIVDADSLANTPIKPIAYAVSEGTKARRQEAQACHPAVLPSCHHLIMAIRHENYPLYGVQFHPEAILTQGGKRLLENFISLSS